MKIKLSILFLIAFSSKIFGQGPVTNANDSQSFTLVEALNFAISNNTQVKNAMADIAYSEQQVKEVRAIGIPQVNGQINFQNALQNQVFVFPVNGVPTPIRVGNRYTTSASVSSSWLMLDGSYIIGLKAAKEFIAFSKKAAEKTEVDVKIDVAKTYFMALIVKENAGLINENIKTLNQTFNQVKALNKEGFTESLEVDRLQLQMNNLAINREQLNDQYQIILGLLKAKIGLSQEKPIKLTDNIESINNQFSDADTSLSLDLNSRTDYQLLQQQLLLNQLDLKRFKYGKYPNLSGAITYQQSNFGEEVNYATWYGNSFYALQVNIPIFKGFANDAKIQKAKIQQIKTENNIYNAKNMITLEVFQTKQKYLRSMEHVAQQKENLALANKILNISTIKYNEGVGSNLELITANQDVKTTQTNYLSALYDLLVAKLDYQIAIGQNIKL